MGVTYNGIAVVPKENADKIKWESYFKFPEPTEDNKWFWDNSKLVTFAKCFKCIHLSEHSCLLFDEVFKRYPSARLIFVSEFEEESIDWVDYLFPGRETKLYSISSNHYDDILIEDIEEEIEKEIKQKWLKDKTIEPNEYIINHSTKTCYPTKVMLRDLNELTESRSYCFTTRHPLFPLCMHINEEQIDEYTEWYRWCGNLITTSNIIPSGYSESYFDIEDF